MSKLYYTLLSIQKVVLDKIDINYFLQLYKLFITTIYKNKIRE